MGSLCCSFVDQNSRFIESKLQEEEQNEQKLNKLLFLGPGASGKSTIFTQLQWLHGQAYHHNQALELRPYIYKHIVSQMQDAIKAYLSQEVQDNTQLQDAISKVQCHMIQTTLSNDISNAIAYIWKYDRRLNGIFQIHHTKAILDETTEYFWNDLERISSPDYVPNKQDIINVRNRTTGIIQQQFQYKNIWFHIFDVGGQKSERKKWIQCFDDVNAIVFIISLSCYNQVMYENSDKNCMVDSLQLFEQTINDDRFIKTPIILFLNKTDLFKKKIKDIALTNCPVFDDIDSDGHKDYDKCLEYVQQQFERMNTKGRQLFVYPTCAMDSNNIERVFEAVTHIIVKQIKTNMETIDMLVT